MREELADLDTLPTISTERLALRAIGESDVDALYAAFSDPEVMRYWSSPPHSGLEETQEMIARVHDGFEARTTLQWGVVRAADERLMGTVTLMPALRQPRAEFGYIFAREFWGKGYAIEAQRAALDFGFGRLGLHRIEADTHPENRASARSLERLGFKAEGTLRERWVVEGVFSDSLMWGLLADEWTKTSKYGTDSSTRWDPAAPGGP